MEERDVYTHKCLQYRHTFAAGNALAKSWSGGFRRFCRFDRGTVLEDVETAPPKIMAIYSISTIADTIFLEGSGTSLVKVAELGYLGGIGRWRGEE